MSENDSCNRCKKEMEFLREEIVADTKYKILKCKKCNRQVARAQN
jgi:ribosomal protein L37AE/L43A